MNWIKASERLPVKFTRVIVRHLKTGKVKLLANMTHDTWWDAIETDFRYTDTEWLDETSESTNGDGWLTEKPEFTEDCLLLTATNWRGEDWSYCVFEITKTDCYDGSGWYWGIFNDGEEWGDIADLKADKYKILPSINKKEK